MKVHISGISYYLPQKKLNNQELSLDFPEWNPEKISNKTGILQRSISDVNENTSDMAVFAANNLITQNNIDKNTIDFILLCTQSPDYILPTTACIVQEKLQIKKSCGALDFNLGCSGFVYGLSLAKGLIITKSAKNVLLITSEVYTKHIHPKDKSNRTIFGDASAAVLISESTNNSEINNFVFGTDGSGAENLIIKNGGTKFPQRGNAFDINDGDNFEKNDDYLYMNGQEIFKYTTAAIPELINNCLFENKTKIDEVDLFIFHQANKYMLDYIRRKLFIPIEKFIINMEYTGNTVSSTIPIAMSQAISDGKLKKGMKVLIAGFGVGYSSSAVLLTY